ncbi:hypothetical protein WJX84_005142 [Apatococcus fuscideae]|uniref:Uncharacterized protein n=1 Tax=Apatococcus fuscideae TaxID=2026836 RepID=A0AAW1SQD3_9CHLO
MSGSAYLSGQDHDLLLPQFSNSWTTSVQQHDTRSLQRALLAAEHSGPPSTGDRLPLRIQTTDRHSHPTEQQRLEAMYQSQLLLLLAQQQDQQHTSRVHSLRRSLSTPSSNVGSPAFRNNNIRVTPVKAAHLGSPPSPSEHAVSEAQRARRQKGTGVFLPGCPGRKAPRSAFTASAMARTCSVDSDSSVNSDLSSVSSAPSLCSVSLSESGAWSPFAGRSFDLHKGSAAVSCPPGSLERIGEAFPEHLY